MASRAPDDHPAALIFHGMTGTPDEVRDVVELFNDKGFLTIVPRLSGHGVSLDELKRTRASAWLVDAERALAQAKPQSQRVVTVGQSFGALLSLYIALTAPAQVRGAVLLSPPIRFRSKQRELLLATLSYLPDAILDRLGTVAKQARPDAQFRRPRDAFDRHSLGAAARLVQIRRNVMRRLSELRCPLLVLQDPQDHHLSPELPAVLRTFGRKVDIRHSWISGGLHELALGPRCQEVLEKINQFVDEVC
ncbi:MAG: alpha/beta fold hydrolase [Bdellovibrionales bacterium]|nr:alpha/beta fold hydrolase [Bdellovibrionales bacterium]